LIQINRLPTNINFCDLKIGDTFVVDPEEPKGLYVKTDKNKSILVYNNDCMIEKQHSFMDSSLVYKASITFVSIVLNK